VCSPESGCDQVAGVIKTNFEELALLIVYFIDLRPEMETFSNLSRPTRTRALDEATTSPRHHISQRTETVRIEPIPSRGLTWAGGLLSIGRQGGSEGRLYEIDKVRSWKGKGRRCQLQFEGCVDLFEIGAQETVEMLKKSNLLGPDRYDAKQRLCWYPLGTNLSFGSESTVTGK